MMNRLQFAKNWARRCNKPALVREINSLVKEGLSNLNETILEHCSALDTLITETFGQYGISYEIYGGAMLLGVGGISIIAHGRSSSLAITNAVKLAWKQIDMDLPAKLAADYVDEVLAYPNPYIIRTGDEIVHFNYAGLSEIRITTDFR